MCPAQIMFIEYTVYKLKKKKKTRNCHFPFKDVKHVSGSTIVFLFTKIKNEKEAAKAETAYINYTCIK